MEYLFRLQAQATVVTVGVSVCFLVRLWLAGELYGAQERLFCAWFVVALVVQVFAHDAGLWSIGLLAQLILAVVLILKDQVDNIF